jgi:mono/diheme cytochrome c family protein
LHCHGLSGDGNGPTAPFLFPRPRDYRLGKFKFTSANGNKPTRADLKKTIENGLIHTSMPSFRGLMRDDEIEQVVDYVIFLSARGESELALINTASIAEEEEAATIFADAAAAETIQVVLDGWNEADSQVLDPPSPRVASTHESVIRGRTLFLGQTTHKLECAGCHGSRARGDGPSWIDPATFNEVVFGGSADPRRFERLRQIAEKAQKKWNDDWGDPLRPADLNRGIYKGGRRPIDIYWRIAKGITGTPMPGHASALKPEEIWDIVNFVLALPYEPELLEGIPSAPAAPAHVAASH